MNIKVMVEKVVKHLACIREVPSLNPSQELPFLILVFVCFFFSPHYKRYSAVGMGSGKCFLVENPTGRHQTL